MKRSMLIITTLVAACGEGAPSQPTPTDAGSSADAAVQQDAMATHMDAVVHVDAQPSMDAGTPDSHLLDSGSSQDAQLMPDAGMLDSGVRIVYPDAQVMDAQPPIDAGTVPHGTLQISTSTTSPRTRLFVSGRQHQTLSVFRLKAKHEPIHVGRITMMQNVTSTLTASWQDYDLVQLVDTRNRVVATTVPTSTVVTLHLSHRRIVVDPALHPQGVLLTLRASLTQICSFGCTVSQSGHRIGYHIETPDDVLASGTMSGQRATIDFDSALPPSSTPTHYVYRAIPLVTRLGLPNPNANNGINDIYMMRITAVGGDIALYAMAFQHMLYLLNLQLVELVDVTNTQEVVLFTSNPGTSTTTLTRKPFEELMNPSPEWVVTTGRPRTFIVRGFMTGVSSNGAALFTRQAGDVSPTPDSTLRMGSGTMASAAAVYRSGAMFVWSDRSVSTHSVHTDDWVNGYLVPGLDAPFGGSASLSR